MSELKPTFNVAITVDLDGDDDAKTQTENVRNCIDADLTALREFGLIRSYKLTLEDA